MNRPPDDLHGLVPRRLFVRHVAAALHEPTDRVRWLMRSGQLRTYAETGRWRWTTHPDLVAYAAQHRMRLDWHALAAVNLGLEPDELQDAWNADNAEHADNASSTDNA